MAKWAALADGCQDQDKIFIEISHDAVLNNLTTEFKTFVNNPAPGQDTHTVTFGNFTATPPAYVGNLRYSIEVDLTLRPNFHLVDGSLDTTVPTGNTGVTATKRYYADAGFGSLIATITSINGAPSAVANLSPYTKVWIDETWAVGSTGILTGSTNTFTEAPEPASLALFGLGLAGMAARARRRSRKV